MSWKQQEYCWAVKCFIIAEHIPQWREKPFKWSNTINVKCHKIPTRKKHSSLLHRNPQAKDRLMERWTPRGGFEGRSVPSCPLRDISQGTSLKRGPRIWLASGRTTPSGSQPIALPRHGTSASVPLPRHALPRGRVPPHRVSKKKCGGKKTLANASPLTAAAAAAAAAEPPAFRASFTDARGVKVPWWIH